MRARGRFREQPPSLGGGPLSENTQRPPAPTGCLRDPLALPGTMFFGISLASAAPCVRLTLSMNTSAPGPSGPMKLDYLVKVPLNARMKVDETKDFRISRGSLIEWLPSASYAFGLASIRWLEEECLVNSAELNQNCERVEYTGDNP